MKLLLLGGPRFLGRAITEAALQRGHELTFFNRGTTNPELYPDVERIVGDRKDGFDALVVRIQLRVRRAAVEERQVVSALERRFRDRASEEPRPAEKQELHVSAASPSSRRSTSVSVL